MVAHTLYYCPPVRLLNIVSSLTGVGGLEANKSVEDGQFIWETSKTPILTSLWAEGQPDDGSSTGSQEPVEMWLRGKRPDLNDEAA